MNIKETTWEKRNLYDNIILTLKQNGIGGLLRGSLAYITRNILYITYPPYKHVLVKSQKIFSFNKKEYKYCIDRYNLSWRNERAVEIPIVQQIIYNTPNNDILEIGCVLKHHKLN